MKIHVDDNYPARRALGCSYFKRL